VQPRQLRKLLEKAGLTQTGAARLIGLTDRTMRRYVSGETPVPRVVICALLYVIHVQQELEREAIDEVLRKYVKGGPKDVWPSWLAELAQLRKSGSSRG
jgi:transcriptional regulator with XRE-family HTH domain